MYLCVRGINFASFYNFLSDFGTVWTACRYFLFVFFNMVIYISYKLSYPPSYLYTMLNYDQNLIIKTSYRLICNIVSFLLRLYNPITIHACHVHKIVTKSI